MFTCALCVLAYALGMLRCIYRQSALRVGLLCWPRSARARTRHSRRTRARVPALASARAASSDLVRLGGSSGGRKITERKVRSLQAMHAKPRTGITLVNNATHRHRMTVEREFLEAVNEAADLNLHVPDLHQLFHRVVHLGRDGRLE